MIIQLYKKGQNMMANGLFKACLRREMIEAQMQEIPQ
jgi:hypothetical protein